MRLSDQYRRGQPAYRDPQVVDSIELKGTRAPTIAPPSTPPDFAILRDSTRIFINFSPPNIHINYLKSL